MQISAVNNNFSKHSFTSKPITKKDDTKNYDNKKVIAAAAAMSVATLTGMAIVRGHYNNCLNALKRSCSYQENEALRKANKTLDEQVKSLTGENGRLKKIADNAREKFSELFESDLTPKELREKLLNSLKSKIDKGELGYDVSTPPITGKASGKVGDSSIPVIHMPSSVATTNRTGMKELQIPEIAPDGKFDIEIPTSSEIKLTHESKNFNPVKNKESSIAVSYGNSVRWDSDKVARDLLQNFYDGHGQTLDGVKMMFTPVEGGKYKVRIEGKSTFTPDKAIYLGLSSKQFNSKAAGNYGEGLKMASLKLLTEAGANDVKIASDNWICKWDIGQSELLTDENEKVLRYSVDKLSQKINGNYIEFETNNKDLLNSLRKSINRFYHSGNKDFECPNFENEVLGIKILPTEDRGAIYIAGQRFEFDGDYDGLKGLSLFIKEKLPKSVLDESRDRISLNSSDLENIAGWIAQHDKITRDEKINIIKSLEKFWNKKSYNETQPMDDFIERFLIHFNPTYSVDKFKIKFPDKYIAYSRASADVVMDLKKRGYIICKDRFANLGMPTIRDIIGDARKHDVVIPNDIEKKKIMILREAISKLAPSLEGEHFNKKELDAHIYMFDRTAPREAKLYNDCNAEAITDMGTSKGFWIDKGYLNKASFSEALETALHEMCHKVGGDESAEFSYKLTDVNANAIAHILDNPQTKAELNALQALWG